jgi:hypothetical protein
MLPAPSQVRIRARFTVGSTATPIEFGLDSLGLAPIDLLAMPETDGATGEIGARLLHAAAAVRPANVSAGAALALVPDRDPSWKAEVIGIGELLELIRLLGRVISGARALIPQDLTAPGSTAGAVDVQELMSRADSAETALRGAASALHGTSGLELALIAAANFGVFDAVPAADAAQWTVQAAAAADELDKRAAALTTLGNGFTRTGKPNDALRDHDVSRLKLVFGASFCVLPTLDAATTAQWNQLWSRSLALQGGDPLAVTTWTQRAARIRPGVSRLHQAMLAAEALGAKTLPPGEVAQLPAIDGDRWIALDKNPNPSASRLSLVSVAPQPAAPGTAAAGLMIDEWVEVLPAQEQITGVGFHADDPTARAPQTILLGVRPDDFPEWTAASVEGTILEALDLAKIRAVDPDALDALGHYLPALYFAYNAGGPQVETVSTDFNLVRAAIVARSG